MRFYVIIIFIFVFKVLMAGVYSGGDGTDNPYLISNIVDLIELSTTPTDWVSNFQQTADITFNVNEQLVDWDGDGTATWDDEDQKGFISIGNFTTSFTGQYDGDKHIIENIYINRPTESYIGFFGYLENSTVRFLGLENVDVTADVYVGGFTGENRYLGVISNCYSTGSVSGSSSVGGLVGYGYNNPASSSANVENCYSSCTVSGTGSNVGGLVGYNYRPMVVNSYSNGIVNEGSGRFGGLIGDNRSGTITNCFWDINTSEQTVSDGGTGKTTSEMKTLSTFTNAGWDFKDETVNGTDDHWDMDGTTNDGYAFLNWGDDNPLPVTLSTFYAESINYTPQLFWITQSEVENLGWNVITPVLKCVAEAIKVNLFFIEGAGTSSTPIEYHFIDNTPIELETTYWYWLESIGVDGSNEYSESVNLFIASDVTISPISSLSINYPNPFNPKTTIEFNIADNENGELSIYNLKGEMLINKNYPSGMHSFTWDAQNCSSGLYFYKVEAGKYLETKKMILLK